MCGHQHILCPYLLHVGKCTSSASDSILARLLLGQSGGRPISCSGNKWTKLSNTAIARLSNWPGATIYWKVLFIKNCYILSSNSGSLWCSCPGLLQVIHQLGPWSASTRRMGLAVETRNFTAGKGWVAWEQRVENYAQLPVEVLPALLV